MPVMNRPRYYGGCDTAHRLENHELRSSESPESWHRRCCGAIHTKKDGWVFCECECHTQPVCVHCKQPGEWECIDRLACEERTHKRKLTNPTYQLIAVAKQRAQDRASAVALSRAEAKAKPNDPRPSTGQCQCCGAPTKGGKFLPGHDAKLKAALFSKAKSGDIEAICELIERRWLRDSWLSQLNPTDVRKAEKKTGQKT